MGWASVLQVQPESLEEHLEFLGFLECPPLPTLMQGLS